MPAECPVLGVKLAITDYAGAVQQAVRWVANHRTYALAFANTHVVALARHDPDFGGAVRQFDLILPDGMPLVWVMNRRCEAQMDDRVYGPTFMLRCLEATQGEFSHFLLGGSEDLLDVLQQKLHGKFPRLKIAGEYSPPFGEWPAGEDARIMEKIAASGAQFVWIGLGCPKQEFWVARNKARLPAAIYCAVGAAFAFHAGRVKQAPALLQRFGMEWLFRLVTEPRRLWRRYFVFNSLFLFYLVRDGIFGRKK